MKRLSKVWCYFITIIILFAAVNLHAADQRHHEDVFRPTKSASSINFSGKTWLFSKVLKPKINIEREATEGLDFDAPEIVSTTPTSWELLPFKADIKIQFNELISENSINNDTVHLYKIEEGEWNGIPSSVESVCPEEEKECVQHDCSGGMGFMPSCECVEYKCNLEFTEVAVVPEVQLVPNQTYVLAINDLESESIKDLSGNKLEGEEFIPFMAEGPGPDDVNDKPEFKTKFGTGHTYPTKVISEGDSLYVVGREIHKGSEIPEGGISFPVINENAFVAKLSAEDGSQKWFKEIDLKKEDVVVDAVVKKNLGSVVVLVASAKDLNEDKEIMFTLHIIYKGLDLAVPVLLPEGHSYRSVSIDDEGDIYVTGVTSEGFYDSDIVSGSTPLDNWVVINKINGPEYYIKPFDSNVRTAVSATDGESRYITGAVDGPNGRDTYVAKSGPTNVAWWEVNLGDLEFDDRGVSIVVDGNVVHVATVNSENTTCHYALTATTGDKISKDCYDMSGPVIPELFVSEAGVFSRGLNSISTSSLVAYSDFDIGSIDWAIGLIPGSSQIAVDSDGSVYAVESGASFIHHHSARLYKFNESNRNYQFGK